MILVSNYSCLIPIPFQFYKVYWLSIFTYLPLFSFQCKETKAERIRKIKIKLNKQLILTAIFIVYWSCPEALVKIVWISLNTTCKTEHMYFSYKETVLINFAHGWLKSWQLIQLFLYIFFHSRFHFRPFYIFPIMSDHLRPQNAKVLSTSFYDLLMSYF